MEPAQQRVPFVFNSPHSGRNYRPQFLALTRLDRAAIRKSEDFRVDELFAGAISQGCPLLTANFPRAFLDVNREPYELDPAHVRGRTALLRQHALGARRRAASARSRGSSRRARRSIADACRITEGLERIETIYKPYHAALRMLLTRTHARFGHAVLVDCHSMPLDARWRIAPHPAGLRARRPLWHLVRGADHRAAAQFLSELGYNVAINKPYAGGFITEHYGRPAQRPACAADRDQSRALHERGARWRRTPISTRVAADICKFIGRWSRPGCRAVGRIQPGRRIRSASRQKKTAQCAVLSLGGNAQEGHAIFSYRTAQYILQCTNRKALRDNNSRAAEIFPLTPWTPDARARSAFSMSCAMPRKRRRCRVFAPPWLSRTRRRTASIP